MLRETLKEITTQARAASDQWNKLQEKYGPEVLGVAIEIQRRLVGECRSAAAFGKDHVRIFSYEDKKLVSRVGEVLGEFFPDLTFHIASQPFMGWELYASWGE